MKDLQDLSKIELITLAKELAWNDEYGCYTRPGFRKMIWPSIAQDARWIIYFDIDGMGELNEKFTHAGVNDMIRKSLSVRASDFMTGQRYSGDEFFVVVTDAPGRAKSDPVELAQRLRHTLIKNGLAATFAIAPVISDDLMTNVEPAVQLVEQAKARNDRGTIFIVAGEPR